ncbi:MAG: hypothetical protein U0575_14750 [Phycisphaerales bacterium]
MAAQLFDAWASTSFTPVRLIGATLSQLTAAPPQLGLFTHETDERRRVVDAVADRIAARFGTKAVRRGASPDESRR